MKYVYKKKKRFIIRNNRHGSHMSVYFADVIVYLVTLVTEKTALETFIR